MQIKYFGLKSLAALIKIIKANYAPKTHTHTIDTAMSSTSTNPVSNKVIKAALDKKVDKVSGKGLSTNDYTQAEKEKLSSIASGAEVNQNAFGGLKVGSVAVSASSEKDTFELAAGSNVKITADAATKKITFSATDTKYADMKGATASAAGTHGLVPAPAANKQGQFLRGDGTWDTPVNTDTKVTQKPGTTSNDKRIILSANANDTEETNYVVKSKNFTANPVTGEFFAHGFRRHDISGKTLDINTLNLSAGAPAIMKYIEKTSGGAANIKNIPVAGQPFLLDVELIRWASTTDYVTLQTFRTIAQKNYEYIRYCTSGTWSGWTTRKFTDTTYATATASKAGICKLYTGTGSATDGSMTQAAITNLITSAGSKTVVSSTEPTTCNTNDEWLQAY